ncbi:MAG: hypothetical protein A3K19_28915 [Lentisphaerae bacterium RIFOXYB12_FULL_65_16]|nr:MAG: hypothetical protein A3K18_25500 [Lentisphaerae bacterium RIFOXYA12_64_32]OGV88316.1 MAG: hypothetical protein A3K19_28915 [Lentisphaerae bacterium RIFOXYB12_FULL_65_16]
MESLSDFEQQIAATFGRPLNQSAITAAQDFFEHWQDFAGLISRRHLPLHVDPFFLAHNFPKYRRYQPWKGAGLVGILAGLATVWFCWPLGAVLLFAGVILHAIGNRIRFNDAKAFAEHLMEEATFNPAGGGFAALCAHYTAGIIYFVTPTGQAVWPQRPSDAITGQHTRIQK